MKQIIRFSYVIFAFTISLGFSACKLVYHEAKTEDQVLKINKEANIAQDEAITDLIAPYKEQLDAKMNEVIGVAAKELRKELPESTLGNWASDAILDQCSKHSDKPVDFAFVNYGGIRIPNIQAGNITMGKIFELMPFDNTMVMLDVKGDVVKQLFENIAGRGGWPMSRGVVCSFTDGGQLKNVTINGEELNLNTTYRIGLSDYVANGGDRCSFFKGIPQVETKVLFRDAFMQQVKDLTAEGKKVDAQLEGRMVVVE